MTKALKISQAKYDQIIDAAYIAFPRLGFSRTTMEIISKQSKIAIQTIYKQFGSKNELFCETIDAICRRHVPPETIIGDKNLSLKEGLSLIGKGFLEMISSPEGIAFHQLVLNESRTKPRIGQFFYTFGPMRMQQLLVDFLEIKVAQGELRIPDIGIAANHFFALLKGRFHLRVALKVKPSPSAIEIREHIEETVGIFLQLYACNIARTRSHRRV